MKSVWDVFTVKGSTVEGPSASARATFADLEKRWTRLERCLGLGAYDDTIFIPGVARPERKCGGDMASMTEPNRVVVKKNVARHYAAWLAFSNAWRGGDEDATALSSQVSGLTMAEREANAGGATIKDAPTPAPDVAESTTGLKAAAATDEAVKSAGELGADWWDEIPVGYKIGAGVGLGAFVLYQAAQLYRSFKR